MTEPDPSPAEAPAGTAPARPSERADAWIRDHLDAVYRYARRRLPPADAEDVAQQSFAALFEAEAADRAPQDAGAYLFGAARRRVADVLRRRALRREPVPLPEGWDRFADRPLPDEAVAAEEMRDLVEVALGLLPAADREALVARYREGVPVAELAARAGTSEKAAEMRLYRARAAFRGRLLEVGRDWTGAEGAP